MLGLARQRTGRALVVLLCRSVQELAGTVLEVPRHGGPRSAYRALVPVRPAVKGPEFMAKMTYPESRLERECLRDTLRRRGQGSTEQFAAAIRERWAHTPLRSWRLALELSLTEVCDQLNELLGVYAGETGYVTHPILSRWERWPNTTRRPSASQLAALARVYRTTPRTLIGLADWDKLPPADRFTLDALGQAIAGTTEPAPTVRMMEPARPHTGAVPRVPPSPWEVSGATRSGTPTEKDVLMTGEESAQYAERGGNIGETTLDLLRESVATEAGRFANVDRLALFGSVRLLRDRIFAYLDGGQPIRQRKDLYFLAAATCGMLATVSDDLGSPSAAMAQARAGHVFAMEVGDPTLTAWLYSRQSTFCYWNGQPGKAREYARRGAALSPGGTVGVWLPAAEARACGELGDTDGVRDAVNRATEARDLAQAGSLDEFGGIMVIDRAKQHFYAAGSFLGIGDNDAVVAHAETAVEAYQNAPTENRAYDNIAISQFYAAIAQARSGNLDAAVQSAETALQVEPEHRIAYLGKAARRLHAQLRAPAVRTSPLAIETRDQIEAFLATTPTHPHLS